MKNIPAATYRIQFGPAFTFAHLRAILPYLSQLGITCIYASPIFTARRGSAHGYDVVDFNEINPELGGSEGFAAVIAEVKRYGMGWLQDMVPNHMAYSSQNQVLVDVGENGPNSKYYDFFDVEWDHPYEGIKGKVLAPFLGSYYGQCLENGELRLFYDEQGFAVRYYEMRFPLRIESYADLLTYHLRALRRKVGPDHPDLIKLHGILGILYVLKTEPSGAISNERYDQIRFIKIMLWELYCQNSAIHQFIDRTIQILNDRPAREESIRFVEKLLDDQYYRLSHWKVAVEEINYRRFFDINELISLRIEQPKVFDHVHGLVLQLIDQGHVSGLRIDHVDGLYDPSHYLTKLHERTGGIYTVVEKILGFGETIPGFWPVAGTTGYDFLNAVNGLFCDRQNEKAIDRLYARFVKESASFEAIAFEKKILIAERRMAGDVENLARVIKKIAARYRRGSDLTMLGIKRAVVAVLARFPVYRTYFNGDSARGEDRDYMRLTLDKAKAESPELVQELHFIEKMHDPAFVDALPGDDRREWLNAMMHFQQLTAPLMAKGVEDTALYVYKRLLSLNEVGGDPGRFGLPVEAFHTFNRKRGRLFPHTMSATATHDTKRGEDARARINVLSELPREWGRRLRTWAKLNSSCKSLVAGKPIPEANEEFGLYQALLGAFPPGGEADPDFVERIKNYAVKAARESKTSTSWLLPDPAYERAVTSFLGGLLQPGRDNPFLQEFLPFQRKIAFYGLWNSLAQTLLKITCPGVPDFYQGTELWDLNLVDPDNRRPVDFALRVRWLHDIVPRCEADILDLMACLLASWADGQVKLFLIHRALKARRAHIDLFQRGSYFPVKVTGTHRRRVVALGRRRGGGCALVAVPRFLVGLVKEGVPPLGEAVWQDTCLVLPRLYPGPWNNWISGQVVGQKEILPVGEVFAHFPAALLIGGEAGASATRQKTAA